MEQLEAFGDHRHSRADPDGGGAAGNGNREEPAEEIEPLESLSNQKEHDDEAHMFESAYTSSDFAAGCVSPSPPKARDPLNVDDVTEVSQGNAHSTIVDEEYGGPRGAEKGDHVLGTSVSSGSPGDHDLDAATGAEAEPIEDNWIKERSGDLAYLSI